MTKDIWEKINPEKELKIIHDPGFEHDVNRRIPSVEKAEKVLGFSAKTTLDKMLDEVIPWIQNAIVRNEI